jgi:hypothetical protein
MTLERFAELVEIYGAEPRRWPQRERQEAMLFAREHADDAERILAGARKLDAALDRYVVPAPGATLIRAIMESAPPIRAAARRVRLWRHGMSFAAAGLAGALAGALVIAVLLPMSVPDDEDGGAYAVTAFTNMAHITDE